jgi:hypothetical protein
MWPNSRSTPGRGDRSVSTRRRLHRLGGGQGCDVLHPHRMAVSSTGMDRLSKLPADLDAVPVRIKRLDADVAGGVFVLDQRDSARS